jgi:hypothetical protein
MSIAQTAELAVLLRLQNGLSGPAAEAEASLSSLNAATSRTGAGAATASTALSRVGTVATGMGNALNHAKGFLSNLITGPLGLLGMGVAVGGVGAEFGKAIGDVTNLGNTLFKLNALTGMSYESLSALIAVGGKYGISTDTMATSVGFAEKTLGKLAETAGKAVKSQASLNLEMQKQNLEAKGGSVKAIDAAIVKQTGLDEIRARSMGTITKLTALEQQYGIKLTDSKGAAVDYQTELLRIADYYKSGATAGQKAALAATLLGRGYSALIPILSLGSQGILDAEAAAAKLGETLTTQNAGDLKNYGATMRELGSTMGGLQLQIGMKLIPVVSELAKGFTSFLQGGGTQEIVGFLGQVVDVGRGVASVVTGTVIPALEGFGRVAKTAWGAIPGPLQTLLIEALVGNKVIKTVFGINIMGSVESAVGGAVGGLLKNAFGSLFGKTIATPVVNVDGAVVNVAGGAGVQNLLSNPSNVANDVSQVAPEVAAGTGILATLSRIGVGLTKILPVFEIALPLMVLTDPTKAAQNNPNNPATIFYQNAQKYIDPNAPGYVGRGSTAGPSTNDLTAIKEQGYKSVDELTAIKEGVNHLNAAQLRVEAAMLQRFAHQDAKKALGDPAAFLTALRSGGATVAIKDFPKHLTYLETASAQQKQSAVYLRGLQNDQAALKRDLVGATNAQKATINSDLLKLQALVAATTAAVGGIRLTVNQISNYKEVPAKPNPKLGPPVPIHLNLPHHPSIPIRDTNAAIIIKGRFGPGSPANAGAQ